jgi:predicted Zn-dependent peptidase
VDTLNAQLALRPSSRGGPRSIRLSWPLTGDPAAAPAPVPRRGRSRARDRDTCADRDTAADDPVKATIHRLSNGMTVTSVDRQQPRRRACRGRAGSRHDPATSTGLAHYLEHMLFKGTAQLGTLDYAKEKPHLGASRCSTTSCAQRRSREDPTGSIARRRIRGVRGAKQLDQLYSRIGVTGLNAFTANDATVYVTEIPKNRVVQWARVEAARYSDPVFRLFWPELEAVYEEKNRSLDNPAWRVEEAFMRTMFPKHGYGYSSGIGEIEHLKKPAYGDMQEFFARYYTPGNMAILLAGDVDASVIPLPSRNSRRSAARRRGGRPRPDAEPPGPHRGDRRRALE